MGNRETSASVERDMDPTPRRRRHSIEGFPPNLLGDSSRENSEKEETERREDEKELETLRREKERLRREEEERLNIFSSCEPECDRYLERLRLRRKILSVRMLDINISWGLFGLFQRKEKERLKRKEEEERLKREEEERLREVNAATIRFFVEFDWVFKEKNPLITGHLTGIAAELDKVIMKATMAKRSIFSSCVPECDRYLKRLQTVKEELLSVRKLYRLRKNYWGLFGLFQREEEEKLREVKRFQVIFPAPDDELDGVFMAKRSGAQRGSKNRLKSLYEDTASDSEQERYKMTPILLSAPKRVSLEDFSIPSFVQLHHQANLSRSTPHSHALGGADTGEALLPPVLVSTLKDAMADLSLVGGGSLDETIRRILQAVLKDEVASELYWAGHGSKQSFQQANLQEVIFRASGKKYSGEAAFGDVWPHQYQLQLQHQQCMLVKAF